jgi:serralysin
MCYACFMKGFGALTQVDRDFSLHAGAVGTLAALDAADQWQSAKLTTAFPIDGVGDLKPPVVPALLITTDTVPDAADTSGGTNPVLTVTGPGVTTPVVSTIDTIGDQDFYRVALTQGVTYELGLYSFNGGPNLAGLTDPYLELYAADGTTLVVSADGGADTVYNQINSGFDVLLTYTPTASGTYYVNARAFSNTPLSPTGDSVGDYQLFVREQDPNDPNIYRPYYQPTEPLYAIDWGTQVNKINQSARNPDGDEGPRDTGNSQGTPVYSNLLDIPALAAGQGVDITGKNVITIYFAKPGDVFVSNDPTNPGLPPATITAVAIQDFEYTAVWTALGEFEKVADVVYLEVQDRDHADFIYTSYQGTPGPGVSLLGSMSPPDESDEGLAQFNSGDERWNARDLAQGGFSFVTLIHEFGHGHGLAHPHDNGGRSGIMNGVEGEGAGVADYTTGDFELNQGVFTMMSYEDGWQSSPYGNASTTAGYGYLGGLMAFDIAAIQDKYGVNEQWATGNDVYTLKDVNAAGTYFASIWDAGGTDAIVYVGTRDTTIDLRAATLAYETGGGGRVSYAYGVFGGFTIANGVTIENATGGAGSDTLIGNAAGNWLDGGAGADSMTGGAGDDIYFVDDAGDMIFEMAGEGHDTVLAGVSHTLGANVERVFALDPSSTAALNFTGNDLANELGGTAGANLLDGGAGADLMVGGDGDDIYFVDNAGDVVSDSPTGGYDTVFSNVSFVLDSQIERVVALDASSTAALSFIGNGSANEITGNAGGNLIDGGGGADILIGLGGADGFAFTSALGSGNIDALPDFEVGLDRIYLDDAVFAGLAPGALAASAFHIGSAAADADDRIIYDAATGALYFDADGSGVGLAVHFATLHEGLALTANEFQVI